MKFSSIHSHSIILYDYVSSLSNLGHPYESIMTLVVPSYPNMLLVHSSPNPSKKIQNYHFWLLDIFSYRSDHDMTRLKILFNRTSLLSQHLQKSQSLTSPFGLSHQGLLSKPARPTKICYWEITCSKTFTSDLLELKGCPMVDWHFVLNLVSKWLKSLTVTK